MSVVKEETVCWLRLDTKCRSLKRRRVWWSRARMCHQLLQHGKCPTIFCMSSMFVKHSSVNVIDFIHIIAPITEITQFE
jgi:hypothetical protein